MRSILMLLIIVEATLAGLSQASEWTAHPSSCDAALHLALKEVPRIEPSAASQVLAQEKKRAVEKLKAEHPEMTGIQLNKGEIPDYVREEVTTDEFTHSIHAIPLFGNSKRMEMGHLNYKVDSRGIVTFKVHIRPQYKKNGLFSVLTAGLLEQMQMIKGNLGYLRDDNAGAFFNGIMERATPKNQTVFNKKYSKKILNRSELDLSRFFSDGYGSLKDPKVVQKMRDVILAAYRESTPAGRVEKRLGLEQIRAIYIDLKTADVRVMSLRGQPLPDSKISISMGWSEKGDSRLWVLRPDGRLDYRQKDQFFEWLK